MAQAQLNAIKVDKLDTPTYNPKFSPPQSQDAFGIETGMYDNRSRACMDREDFGILTTTMDGIITAMNVMSDQINNHTTMVVNELKDQREKNTKFMEKVDKKLLEMKKDMQKILKENEVNEQGQTKQTHIIVKNDRELFLILEKMMMGIMEKHDTQELKEDTFKHSILAVVKEQNQELITVMEGILQNLQEETAAAAVEEPKKRGACFICQDPGHYAPDCPNKPEKKPAVTYKGPNGYKGPNAYKGFHPYKGSNAYYQKGSQNAGYQKSPYFQKPRQDGPTIAERKQNSTCYHCGQQGHWASDCPVKDIPEYNQEFWNEDMENEPPQPAQTEPQPIEVPQPVPQAPQMVPPAPKKRKLSLKKKDN